MTCDLRVLVYWCRQSYVLNVVRNYVGDRKSLLKTVEAIHQGKDKEEIEDELSKIKSRNTWKTLLAPLLAQRDRKRKSS